MGLLKRIFGRTTGYNAAVYNSHMTAEQNDKMTSFGFDNLLAVLEQSVETLDIIKRQEDIGIHVCYNFPCNHPFWDTWD